MIELIGGWIAVAAYTSISLWPVLYGIMYGLNAWVENVTEGQAKLFGDGEIEFGKIDIDEAKSRIGETVHYSDGPNPSSYKRVLEGVTPDNTDGLGYSCPFYINGFYYKYIWDSSHKEHGTKIMNMFDKITRKNFGIPLVLTLINIFAFLIFGSAAINGDLEEMGANSVTDAIPELLFPFVYTIGEFLSPVIIIGVIGFGVHALAKKAWKFKTKVDSALDKGEQDL